MDKITASKITTLAADQNIPSGWEPSDAWSQPSETLLAHLQTTSAGLTTDQALRRLQATGPNTVAAKHRTSPLWLLLNQLKSPLVLMLIGAATVSAFVHEWVDAAVVLVIVLGSTLLGFAQEYSATNAVAKLLAQVTIKATVIRDGQAQRIPAEAVVPGDIVVLSAGSLVPADGVVLEAKDCFVNQAVLTGETFPVEKMAGVVSPRASLTERTNSLFMGTSLRSGSARAVIVQTGQATIFGQIAARLTLRPPETEFERGIRHFGYLLTQVMLLLVLIVFVVNVLFARPAIDALLFAIALAVGIAPELLPAIITLNLSKGAQYMAAHGVIVRRLNAIENLGSMDILCTDKTGTLTEGVVRLDGALDVQGRPSNHVLQVALLNASFQTGLVNPLDDAIITCARETGVGRNNAQKLDEIPYDFVRKRLSVVTQDGGAPDQLITKGALEQVLAVCTHVQDGDTILPLEACQRDAIEQRYTAWGEQGFRVLGVATKPVPPQPAYTRDDEHELIFAGFLVFFDPPKAGVDQTVADLAHLGVQLKIITGDNRRVAEHLAAVVGLPVTGTLTGAQLDELGTEALWQTAERTTLFVEVDPNQKERIILALRQTGHVVGYMGDGINDAPALHAADVGISVDQAVDVAKEAADFVLLQRDLSILHKGIEEGRITFANSLKYIFTTTSANFGNMFSMAGASLFLPFLPLLAKQILLNNFLSDFPAITIASDNVDEALVARPRRWDMRFIRDFMILFGLVSSLFDFLTFGILLRVFQATPAQFRTGWFIESLLTELVIALFVRTHQPFFKSRPSGLLLLSTLVVTLVTLAVPYLPLNTILGFTPLPATMMATILGITGLYVVASEVAKHLFYTRLYPIPQPRPAAQPSPQAE
jgi:Mg2+-importing ATPase